MDEVEWVAACFDYYAEVGRHESGRVIPPVQRHQMNFVMKEPYGVVVCIVPWNYPLLLMAWKVAPALMAGNAVIIKPSEHTPLSTLRLAEVAFRELPRGTVNVITGYGPEAGEPLVAHPNTHVIAFTGSVATGKRIATLAAERVKKVNLELGGNDPFIICDDIDLEVAVRAAVWAAYLNMGQVCTSGERFYVFDSVSDKFIDRFVEFTGSLRLGNPLGPDVDLGPMISAAQRNEVERKLDQVCEMGATVLCGGDLIVAIGDDLFWINDPLTDNDAGPFGGMRLSGGGRELGAEGLEEFRETKHVHLDYKLEMKSYWYPYDWSKGRETD